MKFFFSALCAVAVFIGTSVLSFDAITFYFGKPSRGVSYGISMYYLLVATSVSGSAALILTKWLNPKLILLFGVSVIFALVIWLLPHPSLSIKSILAVMISTILAIEILVLWIVKKDNTKHR